MMTDLTPPPLVDQMKIATSKHHRLAETSGIVHDILLKKTTIEAYTLYLRNLHVIYTALERPFRKTSKETKLVKPFLNEMLLRTRSIEVDLDLLSGSRQWRSLAILESCKAYLSHINTIRTEMPIALLGHIYVRYLGDMNGGQVLERLLKQSLNLQNDAYNFYRYPAVTDLASFRSAYRDMFNIASLSTDDRDRVQETAVKAFEFNIALSMEINSFVQTRQ